MDGGFGGLAVRESKIGQAAGGGRCVLIAGWSTFNPGIWGVSGPRSGVYGSVLGRGFSMCGRWGRLIVARMGTERGQPRILVGNPSGMHKF